MVTKELYGRVRLLLIEERINAVFKNKFRLLDIILLPVKGILNLFLLEDAVILKVVMMIPLFGLSVYYYEFLPLPNFNFDFGYLIDDFIIVMIVTSLSMVVIFFFKESKIWIENYLKSKIMVQQLSLTVSCYLQE